MKVLLTGATGFIGTEILEQCLAHNYISSIVVLTRKPLDAKYFKGPKGDKITEILHDNFEEYPDSLLARLRDDLGVEGCIWALGHGNMKAYKNVEEAQRVGINFPLQAAEAFAAKLAPALSPDQMPKKKFPFRFVFISAWGAEQDQNRTLWVWSESRKIKGAAEKGLFELAENSKEVMGHKCFDVLALRPGGVIVKGDTIGNILWEATVPSIVVDRLAKCAIRTVMEGTGHETKKILENKECLGDDWAMVNSFTM